MVEIVFQERELEDFLCSNGNLEKYLGLRFVARQVKTPVGIVDILAYNKTSKMFVIVELKREILDIAAFTQVERYFHYYSEMKMGNYERRMERFQKLLVGRSLHSDLNYLVDIWEHDESPRYHNRTKYALFGFEFDKAISFEWYSSAQKKIETGDIYYASA